MKLSDRLQDLHECGDSGLALEGLSDKAMFIENALGVLIRAIEDSGGASKEMEIYIGKIKPLIN